MMSAQKYSWNPELPYCIIGDSPAVQRLRADIARCAQSSFPIFVYGETGTGKELVAQGIHAQSKRSKGPFVAFNCGGGNPDLFDSEIFGYEDGAFTGAAKGGKMGKFQLAESGTLFFDEIGDLVDKGQQTLLRALETRNVSRVGAGASDNHVNVRIIAATHVNLEEAVRMGKFRNDAYHRVNRVPLIVPSLRERIHDVPILASYFMSKFSVEEKLPERPFSAEAGNELKSYSWPGNVRELENVVMRIMVAMDPAAKIVDREHVESALANNMSDFPKLADRTTYTAELANRDDASLVREALIRGITVDKYRKIGVVVADGIAGGHRGKMTYLLGISRPTLMRIIEKHDLAVSKANYSSRHARPVTSRWSERHLASRSNTAESDGDEDEAPGEHVSVAGR